MNITQEIYDKIIAKAKASNYGLGEGLTHKATFGKANTYGPGLDGLATSLVNHYDAKYDLISVFQAAFDVLEDILIAEKNKELDELEQLRREDRAGMDL